MKNVPTLLIDTNIWIDAFDGDRKQHMRAHVLLDTAFERGVTLAFAVSSLKDVYYALSSALKRQRWDGEWRAERGGCTLGGSIRLGVCPEHARDRHAGCGRCLTRMACGKFRSQMHDFEDALVAAAASRCHADVLVTNDERFLRHSPVNAMDAADALTYMTLSSL